MVSKESKLVHASSCKSQHSRKEVLALERRKKKPKKRVTPGLPRRRLRTKK